MGILRLILITLVGIWAAMLYFGRDEGLPESVIGRTPAPEPEVVAPNQALDPGDSGEVTAAPEPEPVPVPTPEPEPEPEPAPAPPPSAVPEVVEPPAPPPAPAIEPEPAPEPDIAETPTPPPPSEPEVVAEPDPAPEPQPQPEPEPEPQAEPAETLLYVTGTKVNVRTGPATVYEIITALEQGAEVVDLGDAGEGWRLIRLDAGEIGYMSGDFLSPTPP